jgi:hypothetical protein
MKVIVAGSREVTDYNIVEKAIKDSGFKITAVISGMCRGPDTFGKEWAEKNGIPVDPHPYLKQFGKAGGPIRNQQMVDVADALIAVRVPSSRGTNDCINRAKKKGLPVYVVDVEV